jgi:hypothetical protein
MLHVAIHFLQGPDRTGLSRKDEHPKEIWQNLSKGSACCVILPQATGEETAFHFPIIQLEKITHKERLKVPSTCLHLMGLREAQCKDESQTQNI